MAKELLRVRSLSCNKLHLDLCMKRTQDVCWVVAVMVVAAAVGCLYFHLLQYQTMVMGGMHNFPLRSILKPLNSSSFFFSFLFFVTEWVTDNCALLNEKERERERIFALDSFLGCLESVSWCF